MTTEDLQGQVARSAAVERELREQIGKLREELAEAKHRLAEIEDIDICRLQLPDGRVPGGTVECARMWHAEAQRFWKERDAATARAAAAERERDDLIRQRDYEWDRRKKAQAARTAAESALAEAREALGDISTRCEDKELRYWNTPTKEAVQKRQAIIDYVWSAARAALARAGEQGVLVVCDHAPNEPHQKDGAMPGRVSRHLCLHPRAGEQAPLPEKQLSGSAGPGCGACAEESKEGMPSGSLHGAGEPASSGQEGPAATLFEHYPLPWSIRTDYVSTRRGMYGPETVTHSHGTPQIRDARNVNIMSFSRKQEGDVLLAEWILRTANAQSATPPPGEQGKGADALADGIALVEGWWRRKCSVLQNSHDPNLGSARIDATEVEELLRRMRALATVQPEQGNGGGEGLVDVPCERTFRRLAEDGARRLIAWIGDGTLSLSQLTFAAEAAGYIPQPTMPLVKLLSDPNAVVRESACMGLNGVLAQATDLEDARAALRKAAAFDKSEAVRMVAADALDQDPLAHAQPAEHPASTVIQPAVGPAQDGAGADLPRSGIPPIDHDFVRNTWPKRDECDKRVSDDGRNSRQCGRPRREHQEPGGGK